MDIKELNTDKDPVLAGILNTYSQADAISMENGARFKKITAYLSAAATLVTMAFLLYDEAELYWLIILCGLLVVALYLINRFAKKTECHRKYLEYRLYAESLRVQTFLHIAGTETGVWELLPWAWKMNVPWIPEKLKELWHAQTERERRPILDIWVRDQKAYHEKALERTEKKARHNDRIVNSALIIAVGLYLAGLSYEIFCGGLFFGVPKLDPETLEKGRTILKILLGTVSAATIFAGDYYGKLSLDETIEDHKRMIALYEYAEQTILENGESRDVLLDLAREELNENSNWYAYQMKNRPNINL